MHRVSHRRRGRSLLLWAGLLVSAGFGYVAVRDVAFRDVLAALEASEYVWLGPALAALVVAVAVRAVRWQLLFTRATRPPFRAVARALLVGLFFNNVLPARAGEAARIVVLHQRAKTSRSETLGTVVLERALDVVCLLLLLFALLPWLPPVSWLAPAAAVAAALVGLLAAAAAILRRWGDRPLRAAARPLARLPFFGGERAERVGESFARGLASLRDGRLLLTGAALTTLSWLCLGASMWFVLRAFELGLSPLAGVLVTIAVNLGMILPSSPAAVGVFEAAVLIALDVYGVPKEEALACALVAHVLNFFPFVAVGVLVLHGHTVALRRSEAAA